MTELKVKELIKQLKTFNQEADVSLTTSEDIVISYINENNATPQTTKQLFIEPSDDCKTCNYYGGRYCYAYRTYCDKVTECYRYDKIGEQEQ